MHASQGCKLCLSGYRTGAYLPLMKIRKKFLHWELTWPLQDFLGFPQKQLVQVSRRAIPRSWVWVVLSVPARTSLHTEDELVPVSWSCAQHTFSEWSQTLPAQPELLPDLPSPEQTRAMCCFPQARWRSGLILVHCTPQADKGKRKEQHFLLEEPGEKHLAWLLLLLSVCTVKTTTCYSQCIQQL